MPDDMATILEKTFMQGYRAGWDAAKTGAPPPETATETATATAQDARLAYDARFPDARRLVPSYGGQLPPSKTKLPPPSPNEQKDYTTRFPNASRLKGGF